MPDIRIRLGRNIRVLRKSRGLTQDELARRAETMRETVSRIERGKFGAGVFLLQRIAKVLDVPIAELFDGI